MIKLPAFKHEHYECYFISAFTRQYRVWKKITPANQAQLMIKSHNTLNYSICIRVSLCCLLFQYYGRLNMKWQWLYWAQDESIDGWKSQNHGLKENHYGWIRSFSKAESSVFCPNTPETRDSFFWRTESLNVYRLKSLINLNWQFLFFFNGISQCLLYMIYGSTSL